MALIADLCAVDFLTSVEQYDFSNPMDYFEDFSQCGEDNEEDDVFIDDGHVWCSLFLDEIPFLLSSAGKLRTSSVGAPARQLQALSHKRRISTANPLLPNTNKIRLQELANTELLVSLNEPFGKSELEHDASEDEKDEEDFIASERKSEQQKLTELKRVKVIEEIFETEKKYIACLDILDKVFRLPMQNSGIAQDKDVNALFPSCLSTIKECHAWFMEQLENRLKSEDWSGGIGDILGKMGGPLQDNLLNVYTDYVNSFPKSISTFSKCSRGSQKFRKFIEDCYGKCDNLDLPSYLITPVQRLPRYVLLLRQLSKYTQEDHPDSESIKTALKQMEELISSLNSSIHNSMQAYSARESETRKTIRRQLSRRRKKPRPLSLNAKEFKAVDEKLNKASSPDQNCNRLYRNDILDDKLSLNSEQAPSDEKDSTKGNESRLLKATTSVDSAVPPVVLRKNKPEGKKLLRRSLGAALSSLWSPREDKETKSIQSHSHDEHLKLNGSIQEETIPKDIVPMRRKVGVSYTEPSQILDCGSIVLSEASKSDIEAVKRRRFSGSFRERTRNFRIQMRRRSGTWFTATGEKDSDLDLSVNSSPVAKETSIPLSEGRPHDDSTTGALNRNSKTRSSFVSLFSKRKSKLYSDESTDAVTRRQSECNRRIDPDELLDRQLSTSQSAPMIACPMRESKESKVSEVISEETVESDAEVNGKGSVPVRSDNVNSRCAQNFVSNGASPLQKDSDTSTHEKKQKKGKIMKTLRNMIRKGKS